MKSIYKEALKRLNEKQGVAIETTITGTTGLAASGIRRCLTDVRPEEDSKGWLWAGVTLEAEGETLRVSEPILPQERLFVFGCGHIAVPVCKLGALCGFAVTVYDDRPEFASKDRFPEAAEVICDSFDHITSRLTITPFDYVVIVTRGHRFDDKCLRTVLAGELPAYLGMIGSRRRTSVQLQTLRDEGVDPARIARVNTPIGLDIGAVTPEEIAVSIISEVIAFRRKPEHGTPGRYIIDTDVDIPTLEYLAENPDPKAIATILWTDGSTPRKAGSKMAVSPDGRIVGSVGGGLNECLVIRKALSLIGTGRYEIMDFDLSGDVATTTGMACGGAMKVLVEDACL